MGMSRSGRIITLLVIDTIFFFLEIIVGYMVHSLALVADSFHMLNDVFSLLVALWAIKLSKQKSTSNYTYGWQRAEVLGALVNGVFLLALCMSIFLEAIQRFFEPQVISNPVLILIVGSCGLASNIVGLFMFHDHGHSHGPSSGGDSHGHRHDGHGHGHTHSHSPSDQPIHDEDGSIGDILPETVVARTASMGPVVKQKHRRSTSPSADSLARSHSGHSRTDSRHRTFADPNTSIHVYPAQNRQEIINAAAESHPSSDDEGAVASSSSSPNGGHAQASSSGHAHLKPASEITPILAGTPGANYGSSAPSTPITPHRPRAVSVSHSTHHHAQPRSPAKGGHSHQNLNMRGVFLHVLGDALGNIGVMATALFIWKTDYSWRYYADPVISLLITAIIFTSALPLVKSASKILLQAVPKGISLDEVKEDIRSIHGVESVHELHIWQLSDVKMIASLHIQIAFDPMAGAGERYMRLAKAIRTCLHAYGIHSSTIQPEYTPPSSGHGAGGAGHFNGNGGSNPHNHSHGGAPGRESGEDTSEETCLLECGEECGVGKCCGPMIVSEGHGHAH
ncbi:cation efflux protein [Peziza echinospora]|nr:cation efflux protein [Peziza echinospora]